jgi:hypothetical protein
MVPRLGFEALAWFMLALGDPDQMADQSAISAPDMKGGLSHGRPDATPRRS